MSDTADGDGTNVSFTLRGLSTDETSDICHRDRHPDDQQALQEAEVQAEDSPYHRWTGLYGRK